jgi:hypothetical protein
VPVLLVEDLHWADDSSLDLLQHLLAHAAELPLALMMTAGPRCWHAGPTGARRRPPCSWPAGRGAQRRAGAGAAAAPARGAAETDRELIVGRAEGNPYYMEELVRRLIDDGVIVVGEPHWTVQTDRLDTAAACPARWWACCRRGWTPCRPASASRAPGQRHRPRLLGRRAAGAGRQAPQALPALQRAAFVRDHERSDFEGTPERQFDHHLLHQVTYDTLLKAERRLGHGAAARWLAERTQGRGAEFLAMTGEHAERAGETALAIDCFEQAGKEARGALPTPPR